MRKTLIFILACLLMTGPFLADVCAQGKEKPKPQITFSGDVQYRWRGEYQNGTNPDGSDWSNAPKADFQHIYAWNLRMKAVVNERLFLGMRLSNPLGFCGDNIVDNLSKVIGGDGGAENKILSIPEMYFKWNLGIVSLAGGVIPVNSNTVLDLVTFEAMCFEKGNDCWIGKTWWKVAMNNSQKGLDLGLNFVKNKSTSFSINVMNTIAEGAGIAQASEALKRDQLRFIFSAPLSVLEKKLAFNPVAHMRTNVYRSADLDKANHSFGGGLDIAISPVKQFTMIIGIAADGYKNDSQKDDPGYDTLKTAPLGLLTQIAFRIKPGFGKGMVDIKYGQNKDREDDPVVVKSLFYWDLRYVFPIKGLKIMPRVRAWHTFNNDADNEYTKVHLRPALYFMAGF